MEISQKKAYVPLILNSVVPTKIYVFYFPQDLIPTIEDVYIASVDTGRTPRDLVRIFDTGGLQGNGQVNFLHTQIHHSTVIINNH